jgi:hypothetical protein
MFGDVGDSAGHGDGVPVDHGDARGILEKRDTTPATVYHAFSGNFRSN